MDNFSLQQIFNRILLLKYRYLGSFPSEYVPTPDNDTFVTVNTQRSNMQSEHWITIAKFCHEMNLADSFRSKKVPFSQTALEVDDASTTAVSPQCLWFSSLQVLSGRN